MQDTSPGPQGVYIRGVPLYMYTFSLGIRTEAIYMYGTRSKTGIHIEANLSLEISLESHCRLLWETSSSTKDGSSKSLPGKGTHGEEHTPKNLTGVCVHVPTRRGGRRAG